jgi:hypothetical protein
MKANTKPNPFHVLGLPIDASEADIVARGEELCQVADEAELPAIREAVTDLITHPAARRLHELLEVPGAQYRDDEWAIFAKSHKKPPVDLDTLANAARPLTAANFDLSAIVALVLDGMLSPPTVDLRALLHAPVPPGPGGPPVEVSNVLFG